ncbi:M14 metallopeptidase family protein [Lewinella sp. 4G2]|uniref:M14 metallopeptidase family protein n=1 Tax=Lewinella sp. 4G2 TaxID=1803372 RepID=UPI0007B478BF|nr:M14 metallopeptidase family protein [Lewinella sp. 4G2]OAV45968.1 zinc carboxypeptidase [Lewinella sp. 4G2]
MRSLLFLVSILLTSFVSAQDISSPSAFLPHALGETFTAHHQLVDYFEHVTEKSDRVSLQEYGRSNEGRPLLLATISTPENLARIDAIRENNLRAAGLLEGKVDPELEDIAIVWLSYSVHGNEAAGSEASMRVLHELVDPTNRRTFAWLENVIVLIDPSLNPDGYNRYTNWYRQVSNRRPDTNPNAKEHREPWPGGRVNHYLFDLNRDWAWQTQVESRQRMVLYKEWMPHIHADIHEQGYTSPYYFAPAAAPFHEYITDWQCEFQTEIGKNHASYFDREGWLYFTRERFDLLYPSYGDTYPTFNGSIGMTYEQGGHGRAGRAIDLPNGDTLTLSDRIEHHTTTSLSTVEIASRESDRITENFRRYFKNSQAGPQGDYVTYVVPGTTAPGKMRRLRELLDRNGIHYGRATGKHTGRMYSYRTGATADTRVAAGDLIVSAYQPRSVLTQVLFDPDATVEDSVTYDITGWSVPLAYGLDAYASKSRINVKTEPFGPVAAPSLPSVAEMASAYAIVIPWEDVTSVAILGELARHGVQVRTAGNDFSFGQANYPAGSIIITKADNRNTAEYVNKVHSAAEQHGVMLKLLQTGFSTKGGDLGNGRYGLVGQPKVAILGGENVDPNQFGQVWWYFERELDYPASVFRPEDVDDVLSGDFDVLVLPEGRYDFGKVANELQTWIKAGGKLIAIGSANASLQKMDGFDLKKKGGKDDKKEDDAADEAKAAPGDHRLLPYAGRERRFISTYNPGAVVEVELDNTHPLSFGIGSQYFSLKTGSDTYDYLDKGVNAGRVRTNPTISGFIGAEAKAAIQETLIFGVQDMGAGQVIYLVDNPLYRGFWEEGKLLFGNALFQVR